MIFKNQKDGLMELVSATNEEKQWLKGSFTWDNGKLLFDIAGKWYTYRNLVNLITEVFPVEIQEYWSPPPFDGCVDQGCLIFEDKPEAQLFNHQFEALKAGLNCREGIVQAPTGSGKTEIIIATAMHVRDDHDSRKGPSQIIVTSGIDLARQTLKRFIKRGFDKDEVGLIGDGNKDYDTPVKICVVDSLFAGVKKKNKVLKMLQECHAIYFDEAHHLRSPSWSSVYQSVKTAKYRLSYTATPFNDEDNILETYGDSLIHALTGGVICKIKEKTLVDEGINAETLVHMKQMPYRKSFNMDYKSVYESHIMQFGKRNDYIVAAAKRLVDFGFPVLVILSRHAHAREIMNRMHGYRILTKFGGSKGLEFDDVGMPEEVNLSDDWQERFEKGQWDVVIGTPTIDEGFDAPHVGAVIMGGAGKSPIKIQQRRGRGNRKKSVGRNQVYLIDFQDDQHVYFKSQSRKRRIIYEKLDSTFVEDETQFWDTIYFHSQELKNEL